MGWSELWACYWRAGGEGIQELSYSYIILQNTVICISLRLLIRKVSCFQPRENFFKIARPSFYRYSFSSAGTPRPSLRQTAAQTGKKPPTLPPPSYPAASGVKNRLLDIARSTLSKALERFDKKAILTHPRIVLNLNSLECCPMRLPNIFHNHLYDCPIRSIFPYLGDGKNLQ